MSHPIASASGLAFALCTAFSSGASAQAASMAEQIPGPGAHDPYPAAPPVADDHTQGGWMPRRGSVAGLLRLGFSGPGQGMSKFQCRKECGDLPDSVQAKTSPSFLVGGDVLWHATSWLRAGGGANVIGGTQLEFPEAEQSIQLGPQVQGVAMLEGLFQVAGSSFLTLRGQAGLVVQTISDEHADALRPVRENCAQIAGCSFEEGPYVGYTGGLGLGLLMVAGQTRFRVDLLGELVAVPLSEQTFDEDIGEVQLTELLTTSRAWIAVGMEL